MTFRLRNIVDELAADLHRLNQLEEGQMPNVLMVEDNQDDAYMMKLALQGKCNVSWADTGEKAVESVKSSVTPSVPDFQIVFLDINLPGISGMQVFREIRKIAPRLHVILVTGIAMTESMSEEAMNLGYFGMVKKPLSPDDAREIVDKHGVCKPSHRPNYLLGNQC